MNTAKKEVMIKIKISHFYFLTLIAKDGKSLKELESLATHVDFSHYSFAMIDYMANHLCTLNLARRRREEGGRKYLYEITDEGRSILERIKNISDG